MPSSMQSPGLLQLVLFVQAVARAQCEFGPITGVEVRALSNLAASTLGSSTPHQGLPSPSGQQCPPKEPDSISAQSAPLPPPSHLRGGDGVPAFATGTFLPLRHTPALLAGGLRLRRCSSSQDILHRRLEVAEQDLEHRTVMLRRVRSAVDEHALAMGPVAKQVAADMPKTPPARCMPYGTAGSAGVSGGLLRTQGALHHIKVIARAARSATRTRLRASATAEAMTATPEGGVPADGSLQYPAASSTDKLLSVASGAATTLLALAVDSTLLFSSWLRLAAITLASFGTGAMVTSMMLSERRISPYLRAEADAGYSDSNFVAAGAVRAHYLEALPTAGAPRLTMVCLHGFGSSCASYRLVMQPLADELQARVLSVDMPGFGLTSRPQRLADYCPQTMLDGFVAALGLAPTQSTLPLVILGHSLGGLVASKHVINSSHESVAAAILVAPLVVHSAPAQALVGGTGIQQTLRGASAVARAAVGVAGAVLKYAFSCLVRVARPGLALLLRRVVYTPDFWPQALGGTYHSRANLQAEIIAGYRRASWVRGWEAGLLDFVRFRVTAGKSLWDLLRQALSGSHGSPAHARASSTTAGLKQAATPLLFIHGASDRVIPCANSRFVSSAVLDGQAEYVEVEACGHCPMEERPAEFVQTVKAFVLRTLASK